MSPRAFTFRNHRIGRGGWAGSLVALVVIILLVPILLVLALLAVVVGAIAILAGAVMKAVGGIMPGSAGTTSTEGRRNVRVLRREPDPDAPSSPGGE